MKATYQHDRDASGLVWIWLEESETAKVEGVAEKMEEYGYELIHKDEGECYMLGNADTDITIKQMAEDYKVAKKEAA